VIGKDLVPTAQLHLGGQRPRPGSLHLDHLQAGPGDLDRLLERIQIRAQQINATAVVATGPRGDPVAGGHQLDGEVDEQRRGAADQVRPGTPIG
jgi:hypothetical protein